MNSINVTNFSAFSSFDDSCHCHSTHPTAGSSSAKTIVTRSTCYQSSRSIDTDDRCADKHSNDNGCKNGILGSIGTALIGCVSMCNNLLNTPLISSVGQIFNKFGICGTACHLAPDLAGYAAFKAVAGLGEALGGTGSPHYHFEKEWLHE